MQITAEVTEGSGTVDPETGYAWGGSGDFGEHADTTAAITISSFNDQMAGEITVTDSQGLQTELAHGIAGGDFPYAPILFAWGDNASAQLGLSEDGRGLSPVQAGTDIDWSALAAGDSHTLGIKSDGTLWTWGNKRVGTTGLGRHRLAQRTHPGGYGQQLGGRCGWLAA